MGLVVEAMVQNPESQDEAENHQHCDDEDEDLCCFAHIAHFGFSFSGLTNVSESGGLAEKVMVGLGLGLGFDSFSSSSHGGEEDERESGCLAFVLIIFRIGFKL